MANFDKFGVPIPDQPRKQMGWPKPKNKFRVMLFGFGADDNWGDAGIAIAYETNSVSMPKFNVTSHELHQFEGITNVAGKMRWQAMNLEVKDTIDNQPTRAVMQQIQKHRDFNKRLAPKVNRGKYKFEMWIQQLGGSGRVGEVSGLDKIANEALKVQATINDSIGIANNVVDTASDVLGYWDRINAADSFGIGTVLDTLNTAVNVIDGINEVGDALDNIGATASNIRLELFSGTLATWVCSGCIATDYDFGELDYSTAEMNNVSMSIIPDNCVLVDQNGNPMSFVPGSVGETQGNSAAVELANTIDTGVEIFDAARDVFGAVGGIASGIGGIVDQASGILSASDPTTTFGSITDSLGGFF